MNKAISMEQVHGNRAVRVTKKDAGKTVKDCDALVTNEKDLLLSIRTADCLPIFVYDPKTDAIGAIHAGWRGLDKGIVKSAIYLMEKAYNVVPSSLKVYIGPHICKDHYPVGPEVSIKFKGYKGKQFLDLSKIAVSQMRDLGINIKNIEVDKTCTFEDKKLFSYRRNKTKKRNIYTFGLDI